jgi:hypothetical protein
VAEIGNPDARGAVNGFMVRMHAPWLSKRFEQEQAQILADQEKKRKEQEMDAIKRNRPKL